MLEIIHKSEIALGSKTTLVMCISPGKKVSTESVMNSLWRQILLFEKQFSRFLPNSELSQFNRNAGPKNLISPEFRDLLIKAKELSQKTEGLFNPFILPALQRAGYKKSFVKGYENEKHDDYSHLLVAPHDALKVGDNWASIPYGSAIDLGGCGKGYLGDLLANTVKNVPLEGYWFSIGGDVSGAGIDVNGDTWKVAVGHSDEEELNDAPYFEATTDPFAVATSGINFRAGTYKGQAWHHILDPRTQQPTTTDIKMASVFGNSAVEADVIASSLIIMGSDRAEAFAREFESVGSAMYYAKIDGKTSWSGFGEAAHLSGFTKAVANV